MIDAAVDRVDYGALLECPGGYELDFAVGTTYSLDLEALTSACISLGLSVSTDSAVKDDPVCLFAALSEAKDKVLVFCEKGAVRCSHSYRELYSQVEDSIVQVDLEGDQYPSFHPKLWILRYASLKSSGRAWYRVCVMSRNLTFDSSWDVAGSLSGQVSSGKRRADGGWSLEMTLRHLKRLCPGGMDEDRREKLATVISELPRVYLHSDERGWRFRHPLLFSGSWRSDHNAFSSVFAGLLGKSSRMILMTPFISKPPGKGDPIDMIGQRIDEGSLSKESSYVIVRRDQLAGAECAMDRLLSLPLYAVREDLMSEAGPEVSGNPEDEAQGRRSRDIHAKLYVFEEQTPGGAVTHLLYGSANATRRGMQTNFEAMAHLVSTEAGAFDALARDLGLDSKSQEKGSLFEPLSPREIETLALSGPDLASPVERQFDHLLRRVGIEMDVVEESIEEYEVRLEVDSTRVDGDHPADGTFVSLLSGGHEQALQELVVFHGIALEQLTEFVRLRLDSRDAPKQGLVKCALTPRARAVMERRRAKLFRRICAKDERTLLDYLTFRLSGNHELSASAMAKGRGIQASFISGLPAISTGLYEGLISAYAENPDETCKVVDECMGMLKSQKDEDGISDVLKLLEAFKEGNEYGQL